jgi:Arm DNA-binding domain
MTLTALQVKNAQPGDKLSDGGGRRLDVDKNGNGSWIFRFTSPTKVYETGKNKGDPQERFMGLGPVADLSLAQARDAAGSARALIRSNVDPIEHRNAERAEAKAEATRSIAFKAYAERFISGKEAGWKKREAPPAMAQQPSRLRLSAHWSPARRRREHRWRPESTAADLDRKTGNRATCISRTV